MATSVQIMQEVEELFDRIPASDAPANHLGKLTTKHGTGPVFEALAENLLIAKHHIRTLRQAEGQVRRKNDL